MEKKSQLPLNNAIANKKKEQLCSKESLVKILRWHFRYPDFRGMQLEAIQAVLSGAFQLFFIGSILISMKREFLIFFFIFNSSWYVELVEHVN